MENNTPNYADTFFVPTSLFVDKLTLNITSTTPPTASQSETEDAVGRGLPKKEIPCFEREGNVYHCEDFFKSLQEKNIGNKGVENNG